MISPQVEGLKTLFFLEILIRKCRENTTTKNLRAFKPAARLVFGVKVSGSHTSETRVHSGVQG